MASEAPPALGPLLGQGGTGSVYAATYGGQSVVVKKATDGTRDLTDEYEFMRALDHPNIVRVAARFADGSYAMERGYTSLYQWVADHGIGIRRAFEYLRDVLRALKYLHGLNPPRLHVDLKADNVLLFARGADGVPTVAKLTDFGHAVSMPRLSVNTYGAHGWCMPFETRLGQTVPASDMFTFGALVFHMVSDLVMCRGEFYWDASVPAAVVDFVHACRLTDPARRPSATQALAFFETFLARPESVPQAPRTDPPIRILAVTTTAVTATAGVFALVIADTVWTETPKAPALGESARDVANDFTFGIAGSLSMLAGPDLIHTVVVEGLANGTFLSSVGVPAAGARPMQLCTRFSEFLAFGRGLRRLAVYGPVVAFGAWLTRENLPGLEVLRLSSQVPRTDAMKRVLRTRTPTEFLAMTRDEVLYAEKMRHAITMHVPPAVVAFAQSGWTGAIELVGLYQEFPLGFLVDAAYRVLARRPAISGDFFKMQPGVPHVLRDASEVPRLAAALKGAGALKVAVKSADMASRAVLGLGTLDVPTANIFAMPTTRLYATRERMSMYKVEPYPNDMDVLDEFRDANAALYQ